MSEPKKEKDPRGRKSIHPDEKVVSLTLSIKQKTINNHGGKESARERATEFLNNHPAND